MIVAKFANGRLTIEPINHVLRETIPDTANIQYEAEPTRS
jgi:hypothetical protein